MTKETPTLEVEVLKPAKPAIVPKLKSGDDAETGRQLTELFTEAQNGMRKVIALGLFAWEVKETQLKHGEWGPWLAANAPELCRADSVTSKPKAAQALSNYMELTKGVLEGVGFKSVGKYLAEVSKFPRGGNLNHGGFLLLPDKKVPDAVKPLRDKICQLVDGKTQRQLFLEFKQADEETGRVKRGRLKGQGGASKEQRAAAALKEEQARIEALELDTEDNTKWLLENADDKNFGQISAGHQRKLITACETTLAYLKRLAEAKKGGAK